MARNLHTFEIQNIASVDVESMLICSVHICKKSTVRTKGPAKTKYGSTFRRWGTTAQLEFESRRELGSQRESAGVRVLQVH